MLDNEELSGMNSSSYPSHVYSTNSEYSDQPSAIIGSKIRFKGELVGEEDLIIQGTVDGTIDLKGHNLTVGGDGVINANVSAKTVVIEGKVEGDMFGEEKITIKKSSVVKGNIKATRVSLEDGAKFKGSIDMDIDAKDTKSSTFAMPKTDSAALGSSDKKSNKDNKESDTTKLN